MAAVLVLGGAATGCRAQQGRPDLAPITPAEMRAALDSGTPIDHRLIKGAELSALVAGQLGPKGGCDARRKLIVTDSTIDGDIHLGATDAAIRSAEDVEAATSAGRPMDGSRDWLGVPLAVRSSTFSGRMILDDIGFQCGVDLSHSSFRDNVLWTGVVFGDAFRADESRFGANLGVFGAQWRGPASFRQAIFEAVAEFISKHAGDRTTFLSSADFARADFTRGANFLGIEFRGQTNFAGARFGRLANFSNTVIHGRFGPAGPFYMAEFAGPAVFRGLGFTTIAFHKTVFKDTVDLHFAHGKDLAIRILELPARLDLSDVRIDTLSLADLSVAGPANFQRASVGVLDIRDVDFGATVDFDEAVVGCALRLDTLAFGGDLRLEDARLPSGTEAAAGCDVRGPAFILKDVTFDAGLYAAREQMLTPLPWWALLKEARPRFESDGASASVSGEDRRLWREMVHGFETTGNLELKNYAAFRLASLEEQAQGLPQRGFSVAARWFWGYGLRPWRVLVWIGTVVVLYAAIYWTQLESVGAGEGRLARAARRVADAIAFSGRTAVQLTYGYENSRTTLFRAITASESLVVKLLLACFFYALTQTSPLLSQLVRKLIP